MSDAQNNNMGPVRPADDEAKAVSLHKEKRKSEWNIKNINAIAYTRSSMKSSKLLLIK